MFKSFDAVLYHCTSHHTSNGADVVVVMLLRTFFDRFRTEKVHFVNLDNSNLPSVYCAIY